jgi:lysophospholipase L1-like esterase
VLFQGDSITDAGRDRKGQQPNTNKGLGVGYAAMIATQLFGAHPTLALQCHNRGISGNKVPDLAARWQEDAVDLKPDVLSILIGINDVWHKHRSDYKGTAESYETGYAKLLDRTRSALADTTLVICEPFSLRCGAIEESWLPDIDAHRAAAKRVAEDVGAIWVPFQTAFDDATTGATPPEYWAADGVHPSLQGHALMARTWMDATGLGD